MLDEYKNMTKELEKLDVDNIAPELPYIEKYITKSSKKSNFDNYVNDTTKYLNDVTNKIDN